MFKKLAPSLPLGSFILRPVANYLEENQFGQDHLFFILQFVQRIGDKAVFAGVLGHQQQPFLQPFYRRRGIDTAAVL